MNIDALLNKFRTPELTQEEIDAVWESLGGWSSFGKTFGYYQFALAILEKAHEANKDL